MEAVNEKWRAVMDDKKRGNTRAMRRKERKRKNGEVKEGVDEEGGERV